jgi:hypothetical protein
VYHFGVEMHLYIWGMSGRRYWIVLHTIPDFNFTATGILGKTLTCKIFSSKEGVLTTVIETIF